MLGTASFALFVIVGIFLMKYSKAFKGRKTLHFILERSAALAFLTAGTMGMTGWLGQLTMEIANGIIGAFNSASLLLAGQSLYGVIVVGLAIYWFIAWLPKKATKGDLDMNDGLIYFGTFIPFLLAAATIPLAGPLLVFFEGIGEFMIGLLT
jgi:hypothetical protein